MIPDEGYIVLHSIDDCIHELVFFEKVPCILNNLLKVIFFFLCELLAVELTLKEHNSQEVEQVDLLSIILVVQCRSQGLDNWTNNQVLDLTLQIRVVFDSIKEELYEFAS